MKRILTLFSLLQVLSAFCQPAQFFYGADGKDFFQQIVAAPDGNFFLLGSKATPVNQIWLMKVTPNGAIIWEKTYASSTSGVGEFGYGLIILPDESMIITGQQNSGNYSNNIIALAIKTDAAGNQIWKRTYPTTTALFDAASYGDNFLLVGWDDGLERGRLLLVDGNGILQWSQNIVVTGSNYPRRIFPTNDGNFLLLGRANSNGVSFSGVFLRKIEPDGDQLWQVRHETGFNEYFNFYPTGDSFTQSLGAVQLPDGSITIATPHAYDSNIALLHFSQEGDLLEEKIYGNPALLDFPYSLTSLPDGGWLIAGTAINTLSPVEINGFAMRLHANGLEVWRKYYGKPTATERLFGCAALPNGQFLLAGMSNSPSGGGNGNADGWLLKVDADGNHRPWTVQGRVVLDANGDCTANPGELPAAGWFVVAENDAEHLLMTDAQGNFTLKTDDATTSITIKSPDSNTWTICNNGQSAISNSANPINNLIFVAQQSNGECPLIEVSLTQPDLVRCSTSRIFVTVVNRGVAASDNLLLNVQLDPAFDLVFVSEPYTQTGTNLSFTLHSLAGLEYTIVEIQVGLKCNVPIGASHPIVATVIPLECAPPWDGPEYTVNGHCEGSSARFELQNSGSGGTGATTQYRVLADEVLAVDWTQVNLPEGTPSQTLSFPADGRTWRVELAQAPGYPLESHPAAVVEGCGVGINGLSSVGYQNAWRPNDSAPNVSAILPTNTTGVPNKVAEVVQGLGNYRLIGDLKPLEFTVRARNPLPHPVQKVTFHLTFIPTLDVTTFRALSSNTSANVSITEDRMVQIVMENLQLDTGANAQADALLRFVIQPFPGTPPDLSAASIFFIEGKAYFDNEGPLNLQAGYLNYSETFPDEVDEFNNYPPEIQRFGGRNLTFGSEIVQAENGAVFLVGETVSYSEMAHVDGFLAKTNPYGQAYWLTAIDLGDGGHNIFKGVAAMPDGGCFAVGNHRPTGVPNYISNNRAYIARINGSGNLLWHKKIQPAGPQYGAWTNGVVETPDGGFVMFGKSESANGDGQFYIKFNAAGDVQWQQENATNNQAFSPIKGIKLTDNSMVFAGSSASSFGDPYLFMEKISPEGAVLWNTVYDEVIISHIGLAPAVDGGVVLAGSINWEIEPGVYGTTPLIAKFNAEGDLEWEKKPVLGPFNRAKAHNITPAPDGGFFVGGEIFADTVDRFQDFMLLKIDENGDILWLQNYGAKNAEWVEDLLVSAPDRILLWGYNQRRPPAWDLKALLAHTDLDGNLSVDTEEQPVRNPHQTLVFPNPANSRANIILSPQPTRPVNWMLFDVSGRVMQRGSSPNGLFAVEVDQFAAGIYFMAFPGSGYPPQRVVVVK